MNSSTTLQHMMVPVRKQAGADAPGMVISNGSLDRDKDTVNPQGGDFSALTRGNLPLVWGHDYKEIPIGRVTRVWTDAADNIHAQWKWLEGDVLADRVKNAWDQGIITASSIGFIPKDSRRNEHGGFDHHRWELIELSLCTVPSNREAVRQQLKALGLWPDRKEPMHGEIDITPEQLRLIPQLAREAVAAEFRKVLAPRPDEVDDAEVRRFLREDFPGIVDLAIRTHIQNEVALGMRRAAGRLD